MATTDAQKKTSAYYKEIVKSFGHEKSSGN